MNGDELLITAPRVLTMDGQGDGDGELGVLEDAAVIVQGDSIVAVGPREALCAQQPELVPVCHSGLLTPGLVDAHTHAVWVGSRGQEYVARMGGADYEQLAALGGGIVASMRAVREATVEQLSEALVGRLRRMAAMGVTTVEVKSGYGLSEQVERNQLEAIACAAQRNDVPAVVPTFLGMHALPPEAGGDRDRYAAQCIEWLERIAADGLARYVDAYVDRAAFSVAQAKPLMQRARDLGLGIRLHIGQFADVGGAELAAELSAASVDHLEHVSTQGAQALAEAGCFGVLLPVASFTLGQAPPPIALLRDCGVSLVVASDANPGTAPTESLPLALSLAVRSYGLSLPEALVGVSRNAARSLGSAAGLLRAGGPADLVLWDLPHEAELAQPWGVPKTRAVLRAGKVIAGALRNDRCV